MPLRIAPTPSSPAGSRAGFTLIELVAVMTILGIIAAVVALFMRDPVRAYVDTARRSELSDVADTALRRMARDIRLALPNSLRVTTVGGNVYFELLQTKTGGRYRAQADNAGAGDTLNLSSTDTTFDTLSPLNAVSGPIVAGDILVVHNLFALQTQPESNAYTYNQAGSSCTSATPFFPTCNTATIAGPDTAGALANERHITFASRQFPLASPGSRFSVVSSVSGAVTYVCPSAAATDAKGNGTGALTRVSVYAITLNQQTPPAGTSSALANNVTACNIQYDQQALTQNHGIVSMQLSITRGGETVSLYHEVHVSNVP
ncbi:MAG TPA: type II secretion system protein [Burkholderiales bacterium]|nr:type II secretion system protein [Burkholderiales bacterium]